MRRSKLSNKKHVYQYTINNGGTLSTGVYENNFGMRNATHERRATEYIINSMGITHKNYILEFRKI